MPTLLLDGDGNIDRSVICELREDLAESEHLGMRGYLMRGNREAHASRKTPSFRAGIGECETSAEKISCCVGGGSAPMEVMSRKNRVQMEIVAWAGEGVMPYVQFIKFFGSRTQRSTEEAGEQEDMSTSAEPVEGRT